MANPIPDGQWAAIDADIVANRMLHALEEIRALAGCSLSEALITFYERYARLRAETPERFALSNRDYWKGFYTTGPNPPMAEPGTLPDLEDL
jgi:hypothetical protein